MGAPTSPRSAEKSWLDSPRRSRKARACSGVGLPRASAAARCPRSALSLAKASGTPGSRISGCDLVYEVVIGSDDVAHGDMHDIVEGFEFGLECGVGGGVPAHVADHHLLAGPVARSNDVGDLAQGQRGRLFEQDMTARFERRNRALAVVLVGVENGHHVEILGGQHGVVRVIDVGDVVSGCDLRWRSRASGRSRRQSRNGPRVRREPEDG